MVYKDLKPSDNQSDIAQTFDVEKIEYRLNKIENKLEELPTKLDIQEWINSAKDCALNAQLDKFLPVLDDEDTIQDCYNDLSDELDTLASATTLAEELREKYKLSDNLSYTEVFSEVSKLKDSYGEKIKKYKEIKKNEKSQKDVETQE